MNNVQVQNSGNNGACFLQIRQYEENNRYLGHDRIYSSENRG